MNDMLNNLQTDYIELCNYIEDYVLPLMEYYAVKGDIDAQDCLTDLYDFV